MDRLGGMWCDTLSSLQYALASAVYWNVTARTHREKEGGRRGVETLWRDRREMETVKDRGGGRRGGGRGKKGQDRKREGRRGIRTKGKDRDRDGDRERK